MIQKLVGTELRHELEGLAIDVMGEIGVLYEDRPHLRDKGSWQFIYMYFLGLIIGGGTSQIQKNIISERGLGLPKEPKTTLFGIRFEKLRKMRSQKGCEQKHEQIMRN